MGQQKIRGQVQTGYRRLYHALYKHAGDIISDLQPLDLAINQLQVREFSDRLVWQVTLDQLTLAADLPQGMFPHGCKAPLFLRLSVDLSVSVPTAASTSAFQAPTALATQVEVEAAHPNGQQRAAWHLDLHGYPLTPGTGAIHPRVHWQHGGNLRKKWGIKSVGEWALMNPPRLPYPPMDVTLAICWLLVNYAPVTWHKMIDVDPDFAALVRQCQHWLWAPYFQSIASHWAGPADPDRLQWWPELLA